MGLPPPPQNGLRQDFDRTNLTYSSSRLKYCTARVLSPAMQRRLEGPCSLVFIHPPKVAGTNLVGLMTAIGQMDKGVPVKRFSVPRRAGISPNLFENGALGGFPAPDDLSALPPASGEKPRILSGHMPVGIDAMTPEPVIYVGMMRDPVARDISAVNFDFQRGYVAQQEAEHYVTHVMIDNLQTRLFAGKDFMSGPCTTETLETAQKNIEEKFLFAAPTEGTNTVMQVMAGIYDLPAIAFASAQISRDKVYETVPDRLRETLENKNAYDRKLYDWCQPRWETWVSAHTLPGEPAGHTQKIPTLMPDFQEERVLRFLTPPEIDAHNNNATSDFVSMVQGGKKILKPQR